MRVIFADGTFEDYGDAPINSGAEGEIHRSSQGNTVIKLYTNDKLPPEERGRRIDTLINELNPTREDANWGELFTWPEKRIVQPRVGFRMRFAGGMKPLEHYYLPKAYARLKPEERGWFIGHIAAAIKLVSAASRLATKGLCYPDFSGKNVLIDPFDGRMVLLDCDSLTVPGKLPPTVEGTSSFRAPEIVTRAIPIPSVKTDRHALAVLLYYWLLRWHPLLGNKVYDADDPNRDDLLRYGAQALYIEHPADTSNRASKQILKAFMLGPDMEKLFRRAFVDGLHNPDRRPAPFQWQEALYHAYDQLVPCATPTCGWHSFVALPNSRLVCPMCQQPLKQIASLPFLYLLPHNRTNDPTDYATDVSKAHYIAGWQGKTLHQWHIRPDATAIYADATRIPDTAPQAVFEYDTRTNQWYLNNLTQQPMFFQLPGDAPDMWHSWATNTSIPLSDTMSLQLGPPPYFFRARVRIVRTG